jgi:hypothetical protein
MASSWRLRPGSRVVARFFTAESRGGSSSAALRVLRGECFARLAGRLPPAPIHGSMAGQRDECSVEPTSMTRRRENLRLKVRQWLAGLVLFSYLCTAFGAPLPAAAPETQPASPTPSRPCGCSHAAECCCSRPLKPADCRSCCAKPDSTVGKDATCVARSAGTVPLAPCSGKPNWSPLGCQCQGTLWVIHGTLAPPPPLRWQPAEPVAEEISYPAIAVEPRHRTPPVPPPRRAA